MDVRTAHSLHQALRGDRLVFAYSGGFHDDHAGRLITLGENVAACHETPGDVRGRLAFIMVEVYQNILRHRATVPLALEQGAGRSLFALRCGGAGRVVAAVNPVSRDRSPGLSAALDRLKDMPPERLKGLLIEGLEKEQTQHRRGAGLGLIEMARRSGGKLFHGIGGLSDMHDLFTMVVCLGQTPPQAEVMIAMDELHGTMVRGKVSLLLAGEFPMGARDAVRAMLEDGADGSSERGRAFQDALVLLDSVPVSGSSAGKEGTRYLCLGTRSDGRDRLIMGRSMNASAAEELAARMRKSGKGMAVFEEEGDNAVVILEVL